MTSLVTPIQGIDINDFDHILASDSECNLLLNYLSAKKYTHANFYDLKTILASATLKARLSSFLPKVKAKGIRIGAIRSSYSSFKTTIDYSISSGVWFDELNLEKEFWNGDGTFAEWISGLDQTILYANQKGVRNKFLLTAYIGWMTAGQYDAQALEMVKRLDAIQVHDYRVKPDEPYTRTRLTALSKGAHTINKIQKIIPLFSAEPDFLYNYLTTHSINDVINSYMAAYNTDTLIPYKANLAMQGSHWFDYGFLKQVKP